jgi:hypothetical protein
MKRVLNAFWNFLEDMGEARAAAYLARQGKIIEAKALYSK